MKKRAAIEFEKIVAIIIVILVVIALFFVIKYINVLKEAFLKLFG